MVKHGGGSIMLWWYSSITKTEKTGAYLNHTANWMSLSLPAKNPDLNHLNIFRTLRDLKMSVHRSSSSNLIELERIYQKELEKLPKSRSS